jgi:hypothetical protein
MYQSRACLRHDSADAGTADHSVTGADGAPVGVSAFMVAIPLRILRSVLSRPVRNGVGRRKKKTQTRAGETALEQKVQAQS